VRRAIRDKIMRRPASPAAIDGTGFESRHISACFVRWRKRCCARLKARTAA
jgi:hypothetical protein